MISIIQNNCDPKKYRTLAFKDTRALETLARKDQANKHKEQRACYLADMDYQEDQGSDGEPDVLCDGYDSDGQLITFAHKDYTPSEKEQYVVFPACFPRYNPNLKRTDPYAKIILQDEAQGSVKLLDYHDELLDDPDIRHFNRVLVG